MVGHETFDYDFGQASGAVPVEEFDLGDYR